MVAVSIALFECQVTSGCCALVGRRCCHCSPPPRPWPFAATAPPSVSVWLKVFVIFLLATFTGNALGQFAAIKAPSDTPFVGLVIVLLLVIPQFLFCGVLILLDQIPPWWARWAPLTPHRPPCPAASTTAPHLVA